MALLWFLLPPLVALHATVDAQNKRPLLQYLIPRGSDDEASDVFAQGIGYESDRSLPLIARDSVSVATLGSPCSYSAECTGVSDSSCVAGFCQCDGGFAPLSDVACVPQARYFGDLCVITGQCRHLNPNAVCYKDRCICEPHFYIAAKDCNAPFWTQTYGTSGGSVVTSGLDSGTEQNVVPLVTCYRKRAIGGECCSTKQCSYEVWNSECRNDVCACKAGYVPIGPYTCAKKAAALGDECAVDTQCQDIADSECKADGFCWCNGRTTPSVAVSGPTGRQHETPSCLPLLNLGDHCYVDNQCTALTRNSRCWTSNCACLDGFVEQPGANECLPDVDNIATDFCTLTRQCKTPNTVCSADTGKCECNDDHCLVLLPPDGDQTCLEKVGDDGDCTDACQCRFEGSTCDNGKCGCQCACANGICGCYRADSLTGKCERPTLEFDSREYVFSGQFCCPADPTESIFIGQVNISPSSTDTARPIFTEDSEIVSINDMGVLTLNAGERIEGRTFVTCDTATSQTLPEITATTMVELRSDACCSAALTVLSATITVAIVDADTTENGMGCGAFGSDSEAANANDIVDFDDQTYNAGNGMTNSLRLFEHPCNPGAMATVTMSQLAVTSGTHCTAQQGANTIDWLGTDADALAGTSCVVEGMVTGCNAVATAFTIAVSIPVNANCAVSCPGGECV